VAQTAIGGGIVTNRHGWSRRDVWTVAGLLIDRWRLAYAEAQGGLAIYERPRAAREAIAALNQP
jgi:hypothetical protein